MADITMPKTYDHRQVEEELYEWWLQHGFFRPEQQVALGLADAQAAPFVISMPPPNVTGALHLGHAITNAVEDLLIRYQRMRGRRALWVPGTDHAGIATQNVVERQLAKQGITRQELGRERFVEEVWGWKAEYHTRITAQQYRMGVSSDWQRERFTLDDGLSEAVLEAFIQLYNEGLIYKGLRLVNWCPRCESAISDLEVEYEEVMGKFYTFRYPLQAGGFLEVSTTRPETILGDTAVAVHPDDPRYQHLIGQTALVPMLNRAIPVIADPYVEMDFGTGALKVTPGHDPNDYEIGLRHNLAMLNIMNGDATLNANAGPYVGLDRYAARQQLWEDMRAAGLTVREEERAHQVGHCQRCHTVVEPLLSEQWWVKMQPLAEPAIAAVRSGAIQIIPERFDKVYYHWMENIRDWCISRQLWWGHRIPIWYGPGQHAFAARNADDARQQAIAHYGHAVALEQDPDVLDTWFSSGLWPFSTLGWPAKSTDLATYYPTTVLETGYDILFFWVARMIMMGLKFTDQTPFQYVYLHGLVRDEQGRKMSKSLNNALDPLDLIAEYGSDALRFTLLASGAPGNDMKLAVTRVESNRNFANKLWNAARFVILNLAGYTVTLAPDHAAYDMRYALPSKAELSLADRWILSRLQQMQTEGTRLIEDWQLGEAGRQLYDFVWSEYCDWYIEAAKVRLAAESGAAAQEPAAESGAAAQEPAAESGAAAQEPAAESGAAAQEPAAESGAAAQEPAAESGAAAQEPAAESGAAAQEPAAESGAAAQEPAQATRQVLAFVLEQSLRLLHPYMPFVTEAIWQNLPELGGEDTHGPRALIATHWPNLTGWADPVVDEAFARIQAVVRAIRNARSEYEVPPARKIAALISAGDQTAMMQENLPMLARLAGLELGGVELAPHLSAPDKAVTLAAGGVTTYLPLAGLVDLAAERSRLQKEIDNIDKQLQRIDGLLGNASFVEKARPEVIERERNKQGELQDKRGQLAERLATLAD